MRKNKKAAPEILADLYIGRLFGEKTVKSLFCDYSRLETLWQD